MTVVSFHGKTDTIQFLFVHSVTLTSNADLFDNQMFLDKDANIRSKVTRVACEVKMSNEDPGQKVDIHS